MMGAPLNDLVYDNKKRKEAFETHGFEKGLEVLAGARP